MFSVPEAETKVKFNRRTALIVYADRLHVITSTRHADGTVESTVLGSTQRMVYRPDRQPQHEPSPPTAEECEAMWRTWDTAPRRTRTRVASLPRPRVRAARLVACRRARAPRRQRRTKLARAGNSDGEGSSAPSRGAPIGGAP